MRWKPRRLKDGAVWYGRGAAMGAGRCGMGNKFIDDVRAKLAGRTKRELIEGMLVHSPHQAATDKTIVALEVFPLYLLMLSHDFPTRLWILDRGEKPSSAAILNDAARNRR